MWSKEDVIYETRWTRVYEKAGEPRCQYLESRFQDGTATITLDELQRDWHQWPDEERIDFCQSFYSWARMPEREEIVRFLIQNGDHNVWRAIALEVAQLPAHEAVPILIRWCESAGVGGGASYFQALAFTGDPQARNILRRSFQRIWEAEGLMDDASFVNWVAYDAIGCIEHLCELGEDCEAFRAAYEQLMSHPCERIREDVQRRLAAYFPG